LLWIRREEGEEWKFELDWWQEERIYYFPHQGRLQEVAS
jgi:hypothetical protein